jgi:alpha-amylase
MEARLVDKWKGFSVSFETAESCELIRFPIETVSQSEGGIERTHQGSCLHFIWNLELAPQGKWKNKLVIQLAS